MSELDEAMMREHIQSLLTEVEPILHKKYPLDVVISALGMLYAKAVLQHPSFADEATREEFAKQTLRHIVKCMSAASAVAEDEKEEDEEEEGKGEK